MGTRLKIFFDYESRTGFRSDVVTWDTRLPFQLLSETVLRDFEETLMKQTKSVVACQVIDFERTFP
jgi:hypothetical protein